MRAFDTVDEYGLSHLIEHLLAAGRADDVHLLLGAEWPRAQQLGHRPGADNAWYLTRERTRQTADFLHDVRLARQYAQTLTDQTLARGEQAPTIGLELRYMLVTASISSITANLPTTLLAAVVDKGIWTVAQALAYTHHIPGADAKAAALQALVPHLPAALLAEALAAARAIPDPSARAEALGALAPHLPAVLLADALAAARSLTDPDGLAHVLGAIAQRADGGPPLRWDVHWRAALSTAATHGRATLAGSIGGIGLVIARFGGPDAVRTSSQALVDVARWWP
jgi:hypothetical protein